MMNFPSSQLSKKLPAPTEPGDERKQAKGFRNPFIENVHHGKQINK